MAKIANALMISEIEQILYAKNPYYELEPRLSRAFASRHEMAEAHDRQILGCARLGPPFSTLGCGMSRCSAKLDISTVTQQVIGSGEGVCL
jgi:hypothetical protein